jgi:hypothetical protein
MADVVTFASDGWTFCMKAFVTNNRYTSSAEQLASTNGILLLLYSDLANLDSLLQHKSPGVAASQKPMMRIRAIPLAHRHRGGPATSHAPCLGARYPVPIVG